MTKSILVIDDDQSIRDAFTLAMEDAAYDVLTADNGTNGAEIHRDRPCDLIFLDLKMPGLDGPDTLRQIRKHDPNVPVYIITAFHKEFFDKLEKLADDDVEFELLQKPIGQDQILRITQGILEGGGNY